MGMEKTKCQKKKKKRKKEKKNNKTGIPPPFSIKNLSISMDAFAPKSKGPFYLSIVNNDDENEMKIKV